MYSFQLSSKSIIGEGLYDLDTDTEIIFDSLMVFLNSVIFSIVITYVGNIYANIIKKDATL